MRRLSSHLLLTPSGELLPGRVVSVDDGGRVVSIEAPPEIDSLAGVEFYPGILMPGLLNAHCHLELSWMRGKIPVGCGFEGFVDGMRVWREETDCRVGFQPPRNDVSQNPTLNSFWDAKMWAEGVSEVWDICNGKETFELKRASKIKYRNFCEFFGRGAMPDPEFHNTPHSLYALDAEAFSKLSTLHSPLSIHFMESEFEVDDPAVELVRLVPADREVILVHNCLVTQRDIDIVMGHFTTPVTWVVCPRSNRYISGLTPPVELLRKNRLRIAVGTDSLASNDTLSMVGELAELARLTDAPLAEMLGWVCKGTGMVNLTGVDPATLALTENAHTKRII